MARANSPDASGQKKGTGAPANKPQPNSLPASPDTGQAATHGQTPEAPARSPSGKSLFGKAKDVLSDVATQASSASRPIASKAVSLSKSGVAKTAEIGKQAYAVAGDATRGALKAGTQAYAGSKLESAVQFIDAELDQRGAKQAAKETSKAIVGKLDQVTGKRLVELLEKKLQVQDAYNDTLATRLAEALERIGKLEAEVADLRSRKQHD